MCAGYLDSHAVVRVGCRGSKYSTVSIISNLSVTAILPLDWLGNRWALKTIRQTDFRFHSSKDSHWTLPRADRQGPGSAGSRKGGKEIKPYLCGRQWLRGSGSKSQLCPSLAIDFEQTLPPS